MANEARWAELAITNLVSNKREWNNILLNSDLDIIAKFYRFLILQSDRKLMWQKQQQVGSHMAWRAHRS